MSSNTQRHGFTLVELLLVMALVGIVIGIAAPLLRPERFQMDGAVVLVASTFTAQQRNAVLRQHDIVVAVDSAAGEIRVHYDTDNDNSIDSGEQWNVVQLENGITFGRGSTPARALGSAMVSWTEDEGGLPALTFRRNGSASEESVLYLTSLRGAVEDGRAIEIERATGRVRCYSYATGVWIQTC